MQNENEMNEMEFLLDQTDDGSRVAPEAIPGLIEKVEALGFRAFPSPDAPEWRIVVGKAGGLFSDDECGAIVDVIDAYPHAYPHEVAGGDFANDCESSLE